MSDENKESLDILYEFGLTENQAKVFIATVRLGTPTVSEISEKSEVRREEVYRLLPELEKMGLIERLLGKPLRLKTPNPKSAITALVKLEQEKAKDRITELSNRSKELLKHLDFQPTDILSAKELDSDFSLLQEKESIRVGLYDMIKGVSGQLDILFSRSDLIWLLSTLGEVLQEAAERGVKIRIMSEPPSGRDRLPKILERRFPGESNVPMKYLLNPTAFYVIADKSQLMLITSGTSHLPSAVCLLTDNESLVAMTSSNFEDQWHESVHWKTVDGITLSVAPRDGPQGGASQVHRILLYKSSKTKFKVLFNFLKNRYENGYMIIYVGPENCTEEIKEAMYNFGFDKNLIDDQKQIRIFEWTYWLLDDGSFNSEKAIDVWDDIYFEAQDLGFSRVAVVSEMKFFFDNDMISELEEYEKEIHDTLGGQIEFKCAYDEKSILGTEEPLQLYARLLEAHSTLLTEEKEGIKRTRT